MKVDEVSSDSINRVFYAILSTSREHSKKRVQALTQDGMMKKIPGSETFYAANNKDNKIEYDITVKREFVED